MEGSSDLRQSLVTLWDYQGADKDNPGLTSLCPSELGTRSQFRFQGALRYTQAFGAQLQPPNWDEQSELSW